VTRTFHRTLLIVLLGLTGCAGSMPRAWVAGPIPEGFRIAILPLANYTDKQDASDRIVPLIAVEAARQRGVTVIDPGRVEALFAKEPWLLLDRLPPETIDRFGKELDADALIVGSILAFGYRDQDVGAQPEFSVTLRLLRTPGGECLWSGTQARSGNDHESVFGLGRIDNLERLASSAVKDLVATFPKTMKSTPESNAAQNAEKR
jgi:hypothetical protein